MAQLAIPVSKGKGTVTIDTDEISEEVYQAALMEGLKLLVNTGKTIKAAQKGLEGDALAKAQAAALQAAQENADELHKKRPVKDADGNPKMDTNGAPVYEYAGKVKLPGRKATKSGVPGTVMTEARRVARNLVKDAIKRNNGKISHYEASEITKAANELIAADPTILAQAEKNLAERAKVDSLAINVVDLIKPSDKLVAAAEAKAAKAKADKPPLSAAQAGKVAPRKKGQQLNA